MAERSFSRAYCRGDFRFSPAVMSPTTSIQHVQRAATRIHVWIVTMCSTIVRNRGLAAVRQYWLCFYCALPMKGDGSPYESGLRAAGSGFAVTAEHLVARGDGGNDDAGNIAAAHAICNRRRHRCRTVLEPTQFAQRVQGRIAAGRWFSKPELAVLQRAVLAGPRRQGQDREPWLFFVQAVSIGRAD